MVTSQGRTLRVLVAGATGYLGGYVLREFKARGHWVRALARRPEKLEPLEADGSLDEVFSGQVTRPETLRSVCDGIDVVFSSVGITRQRDGLSFRDVDYLGNLNLLRLALEAAVSRFVYVSVFNAHEHEDLAIVRAHEDFVRDLRQVPMESAVIRPTGYFSDMEQVFEMARSGRVWLFGDGRNRLNPIHGADLAKVCVDAATAEARDFDVGGPDSLSSRQIAELAFACLGKPPKITHVPLWLARLTARLVRLFSSHQGELLAFLVRAASSDGVAPATGTHHLEDHFRQLAEAPRLTDR